MVNFLLFVGLIWLLIGKVVSSSISINPLNLPLLPHPADPPPPPSPRAPIPPSALPDPYPAQVDHEAGMDFLYRWNSTGLILFNRTYYFERDLTTAENRTEVLQFVQQFIREIKGVRLRKSPTAIPLIIRPAGSVKVPWCHHPYLLRELVKLELQLYQIFANFYLYKENKGISLMVLDSWLVDIERTTIRGLNTMIGKYGDIYGNQDPAKDIYVYVVSHPVLLYRMIRRYAEDLNPILMQVATQNPQLLGLLQEVTDATIPKSVVLPDSEDLFFALDALRRIQQGHLLDTYEFAQGNLGNINTRVKMTAMNCLEFGAFLLERGVPDLSLEWLQLAIEKVKISKATVDYPEIEKFVQNIFDLVVFEHNSKIDTVGSSDAWTNRELALLDRPVELPFNRSDYPRFVDLKDRNHNFTVRSESYHAYFHLVCSGRNFQTEEEKSKLSCWYERSLNPYWYIGPLKFESLNQDPPIRRVYDFFGEKVMNLLKSHAHLNMEQSGVSIGDGQGGSKLSPVRTSTEAHLSDKRLRCLIRLTKRLELLTGYRIYPPTASSSYLVACYSSSHHYDPHTDPLSDCPQVRESGNRITTLMGYLSDPRVGGRTGFPRLGLSVEPIRGSLVFWHNMKRNGKIDGRMLHGGCPVVLGLKWITNKWVHYNDNFRTFHCTRNAKE